MENGELRTPDLRALRTDVAVRTLSIIHFPFSIILESQIGSLRSPYSPIAYHTFRGYEVPPPRVIARRFRARGTYRRVRRALRRNRAYARTARWLCLADRGRPV